VELNTNRTANRTSG